MPKYRPLKLRLLDHCMPEPNTGCWLWVGSICQDGYGKINGGNDLRGETLAHRAAFLLFVGEIPAGTEIDHKCFVRSCINPDHLQAISHLENVRRSDHKTNHPNRIKTTCSNGHFLTGKNLITERDGLGNFKRRRCRSCLNEMARRRWAKNGASVQRSRRDNCTRMSKNRALAEAIYGVQVRFV